jgi:hypothetical protein
MLKGRGASRSAAFYFAAYFVAYFIAYFVVVKIEPAARLFRKPIRRKGQNMANKTATFSKCIVALAGILFLALCWHAYRAVGGSGFDNVLAEPWGRVTLADVMLGGICMGAVIFAHEKQKRVALMWALPIFIFGHVVSVAWLLMRFLPAKAE